MYWKSFLLRNHILAIMLSFVLVQGCSYQSELKKGDTGSGTPSTPVVDFTLAPTAATIAASGTLQFLTVGGTSPYSYSITSGGGSISSTGLFTAPSSSDTVVIKVTDSAGQSLESTLTIVTAGTAIPPVVKIITPAASAKFQSTATVMGTCKGGVSVTVSGAGVVAPTPTSVNCSSGVFTINATFSNGDGNKIVQVAQTDADGSSSDSRTFVSDLTPPTSNSIAINSNDTYTQSLAATLTLASTDAVQMKILDSADCSGSGNWEEYSASKSWALKNANATNNVSVLYKDDVGNISTCVTDSIVHDNQAPALTITSPTDGSYVQPTLTITGGCEAGQTVNIGGSGLSASTTATCTASNYSASVTLSAGEGSKQIQVSQTDAAGNSKTVTANVVVDTLPPLANAITIDGGNAYATSTTVSLGLTSIGASEMLITNNSDCATGGTWEAYALTKSWTLPTLNAVNTVYAKFKDVAGNVSSCVNAFITHDNTPPSAPTLSINGGASETKDTSVTLALSATGAGQMKIFDTVDCTGSGTWESYGTTKSWVLKNTNALNSLSVLFKDGAGNTSTCASATITHDSTAPTLTIVNPTANTTVGSTGLAVSGSCESGLPVAISGDISAPKNANCNGTFSDSVVLTAADGVKNLQFSQTDLAGNITTVGVALNLSANASTDTITINGGASVTNSTSVTLALSSAAAAQMLITDNSDCSTGGTYEAYATSKVWTLPTTNALNTVYVKFKDGGGTESSCISASILHDNIAPTSNSLAVNGGATVTNDPSVMLNLASTGAAQMLITDNSDCTTGGSWEGFQTTKSWTLPTLNSTNTVYAKFKDAAGNVSACVSGSIVHDDQGPTAPSLAMNSGASYTNSLIATLDLSSTDATQMKITNSADCSGAGIWEPFQATKLWVLPSANASNSVSAAFKDSAGNISACAAASIVHDNIAPGLGVTTPTLNQLVSNTVTVSGACEDGFSISLTGAGLLSSATATCSGGGYSQSVSLSAGDGTKAFTVTQTDLANNQASVNVTVLADVTAPTGNSLSINSGATATNSTSVALKLISTGATEMLVTNSSDCATGGVWEAYAVNKAWTLGQINAVATVYAKFRDGAGNVSSCVNDTIVHDDQPPALAYVSPADGSSSTNKITITGTCENGLLVALSGSGLLGPASTSCNGTFSQEVTFTAGAGAKPITISQTDSFGNTTSVTRTFQNTTAGPVNTSLAINSGAAATSSTSVTLTLVATNATEMYITNTSGCASGGAWESYSPSKAWVLGQTNATATVYVKYRDAALSESACLSASIIHDDQSPVLAFTSPAAAASVGGTATVSGTCESGLTVSVAGTGLNNSVTANCTGTFSASVTFTAGNGNKAVQVSQTDAAGNVGTASRTFSATNTPPTGLSLVINGGAYYTNSTAVTLTLGATGASEMYITNTADCASGGVWESFNTSKAWSLGQTNATATVFAKYRDALGNTTGCIASTIVHDNVAPTVAYTSPAANTQASSYVVIQGTCEIGSVVDISGTGAAGTSSTPCASGTFSQSVVFSSNDGNKDITISQTDPAGNTGSATRTFVRNSAAPSGSSLVIAGGNTYTNTTSVTLTLASVGATEMYITNTAGCASGGSWEAFSASKAWSLGQTNGTATVYAKFKDSLSNVTGCVSDTIIHDNVAPSLAFTSPAANTAGVNGLTVSGTCETGFDVTVSGTGVSSPVTSACAAGTFTAAITFAGSDGIKNVVASQTDTAGNTGTTNINYLKTVAGVLSGTLSMLVPSADEAPSDGVAEVTLFVTLKDYYGNLITANNTVEVTVSSANVTLATGTACRTPSGTCMKAVSAGNGVYTLTAKTSVAGSYSFTTAVAGSPDTNLSSASVNFNDANFTVITAATTITGPLHAGKNLYFKTTGQSTFDNTTDGQTFKNIFIGTGTSITHTATTNTVIYRLNISASSLNMMGTAAINADNKGFTIGYSYGPNYVPSNAAGIAAVNAAGASHGGVGAWNNVAATDPGIPYGNYRNPIYPGGGGTGAVGGGVVRITASNACVLNTSGAAITANATTGGGGAGGSIYLKCNQFGGTAAAGAISAKGADATVTTMGSGGGRVALVSDNKISAFTGAFTYPVDSTTLTNFKNRVSAYGGKWYSLTTRTEGGAGTVFLSNADKLNGTLIIDNGYPARGSYGSSGGYAGYTLLTSLSGTVTGSPGGTVIPVSVNSWPGLNSNTSDMYVGLRIRPNVSFTNGTASDWSDDNVQTIANHSTSVITTADLFTGVTAGSTFRSIDILDGFDVGGGAFVKTYGDMYVSGSWVNNPGSLSYSPPQDSFIDFINGANTNLSYLDLTFSYLSGTFSRDLTAQNLTVNGTGAVIRADNLTVTGNLAVSAGTLYTANLNVTGNATVSGTGTVKQNATTATQEYRLVINIGGALNLNTGGTITAAGQGYLGGYSFGVNGPTASLASINFGGGSHGGLGAYGNGTSTDVGPTYDDYRDPNYSGGGSTAPAAGGGVIRLTATGNCSINGGKISADGATNGAAGGSVKLTCSSYSGTTVADSITAKGGNVGGSRNPGGGGRIALYSTGVEASFGGGLAWPKTAGQMTTFKGYVKANGGVYSSTANPEGGAGTIFLKHSGLTYGALLIDNASAATNTYTSSGVTALVSIAGMVNATPSGNNLPVNVTSTPGPVPGYTNLYKGLQLRPNLAFDNGTPDWLDDNILTVSANTLTSLTTTSPVGSVSNGASFRSIDILDYLEVSGNARIKTNGDIYVVGGAISSPASKAAIVASGSYLDYTNGGDNGINYNFTAPVGSMAVSNLTGAVVTVPATSTLTVNGNINATSVSTAGTLNVTGCINTSTTLGITAGVTTTDCLNVGTDLSLSGSGVLTHYATDTTTLHRLVGSVGGNFSLAGTSSINLMSKGYRGLAGTGYSWGSPDGRPSQTLSTSGSGPAHAGSGNGTGVPYDDIKNPQYPGAGGSGATYHGGGAVRLTVTGSCTINSGTSINADGDTTYLGAGGSIYLKCSGFAGTAGASAVVARGTGGTGSSGGMIALISTGNQASFAGSFAWPTNSAGVTAFTNVVRANGPVAASSSGSIYIKHSGQQYGSLILDNKQTTLGGSTFLRSISGVITGVSGNNITMNVTSSPGLNSNFSGAFYTGMMLRPDISATNGTPADLTDDNILTVTSNSSSGVTVASTGTGVSVGTTFRTIDIYDNVEVLGGAVLKSNGDLYVVNGTLSNPGGTDMNFTQGLIDVPGFNYQLGDVKIGGTYTISSTVNAKSFEITSGTITTADITATQGVKVSGGLLYANNITAGTTLDIAGSLHATGCVTVNTSATISVGLLKTDCLNITNNLTMTGGTINHWATDASTVHRLIANIGGSLTMSGAAKINADGLGYTAVASSAAYSWGAPDGRPSTAQSSASSIGGSHGGLSANGTYTYDDYRSPQYPGAGGFSGASINYGGGVIRLTVTGLCTLGGTSAITANGQQYSAGGSVYMNCGGFAGTPAAGAITASAAQSSGVGGGGMVALISTGDNSSFTGNFAWPTSAGTLTTFTSTVQALGGSISGGAGTIFIKHSGQTYGSLILDNKKTMIQYPTVLRGLSGTITGVSGNNLTLNVASTPALGLNYINYYSGVRIRPDLTYSNGTATDWTDDNVLTVSSNSSTAVTVANTGSGVTSGKTFRSIDILDTLDTIGGATLKSNGDLYVLSGNLTNVGAPEMTFNMGLVDVAGSFNYPIGDMTLAGTYTLPPNLSTKTFTMTSGGALTATNITTTGTMSLTGTLAAVNINAGTSLTVTGGSALNITGCLASGTSFTMTGGTLTTDCLNIGTDMSMSAGTIQHYPTDTAVLHRLVGAIGGNLALSGTAKINVDGLGYKGVSSTQGYSWGAPDGRPSIVLGAPLISSHVGGSHGGLGRSGGVTYDDYRDPQYPGAGAASTGANPSFADGGGVVRLTVNGACTINGTAAITAIGENGGASYFTAGAGGSIYMRCASFGGTAAASSIAATGKATYGAGGGMVALISTGDQSSFTGTFTWPTTPASLTTFTTAVRAEGGSSSAGAGTIYIKHSGQQYGSLILDNKTTTLSKATQLRGFEGAIISVSGTTFTPGLTSLPNLSTDYANYYQGVQLRPDLTYTNGTATNWTDDNVLTVSGNSESAITVASVGSGVSAGKSLRSIDILDNLEIVGGAILKSNGDVYVLNGNLTNSGGPDLAMNMGFVELGGSLNMPWGDVTVAGTYTSNKNISAKSFTVNGAGTFTGLNLTTTAGVSVATGTATFTNVNAGTSVSITSGAMNASGCLTTSGSLSVAGGTLTTDCVNIGTDINMTGGTIAHYATTETDLHRLIGTVGGNLNLSGTAKINLNGLGYYATYSSGLRGYTWGAPDGRPSTALMDASLTTSNGGSHAGYGSNGGDTFDDYRNPQYPGGSARGYYWVPNTNNYVYSSGGGVLRLTVNGTCTVNTGAAITALSFVDTGNVNMAGAGGSIYLKCAGFAGTAGSGAINASASQATGSEGGGGMVALISTGDQSSFTGNFAWPTSAGSLTTFTNTVQAFGGLTAGGAGTVYIKHSGQQYGSLIINNNKATIGLPTILRGATGTISSVSGNNIGLNFTSLPALSSSYEAYYSGVSIRPDLSFTNGTASNWSDDNVLSVTTNSTSGATVASTGSGVSIGTAFRTIDVLDNLEVIGGGNLQSTGDVYVLNGSLSNPGSTMDFNLGLVNAANFNMGLGDVTWKFNTTYSTTNDLNLKSLNVTGGTLTVNNLTTSVGGLSVNGGTVNAVNVTTATSLTMGSGAINATGCVNTGSSFSMTGGVLQTDCLGVATDLTMTAGMIKHYPTDTTTVHRLTANIGGNLSMSGTGKIFMDGLGYPATDGAAYSWGAPDGRPSSALGSINATYSGGSHGGFGQGANPGAIYDDYRNPMYPGAGSDLSNANYPAAGGGVLRLTANGTCTINTGASITSHGAIAGNSTPLYASGAGGSIYMKCAGFAGTAAASAIAATGGTNANAVGGGGMVALISTGDQNSFVGSFAWPTNAAGVTNILNIIRANGGVSMGGPGTIYLKNSSQQYGSLLIDAKRTTITSNSNIAQIRGFSGTITGVSGNNLTLNVNSNPALSSDYAGYYSGLNLRPDLSYTNGTANNWIDDNVLKVSSNDSSSMTVVNTGSGVSSGTTFRSIDILDNLDITGGAILRSSGDIYVLSGSLSNSGGADLPLTNGYPELGGSLNYPLGDISLTGNYALPGPLVSKTFTVPTGSAVSTTSVTTSGAVTIAGSLTTNSMTVGTSLGISAGGVTSTSISTGTSLNITGGSLLVQNLAVGTDLTMSAGTLTHPVSTSTNLYRLIGTVGGSLTMTGGTIHAQNRGYPINYSYGDGAPSTALAGSNGSHAGFVASGTGYIYGSVRDPDTAGGGSSSSSGGGVLKFTVNSTCSFSGATTTVNASGSNSAAGGSINFRCAGFSGTSLPAGAFTANALATDGSGGRIALVSTGPVGSFTGDLAFPVDSTTLATFKAKVQARGNGSGISYGGAGTIYLKHSGQTYGSLIVDNGITAAMSKATLLPSMAGVVSSAPSGAVLPVSVNSNPALNNNFVNAYKGMMIRPTIGFNNGTPNDWTDDNILNITANGASTLTASGTISGVTAGDSFRSIDIFDTIDVGGGATLVSNGDIYVLSGAISDVGAGKPLKFTNGWIGFNPTGAGMNATYGDLSFANLTGLTSPISAKSVTASAGTYTGSSITATNGAISLTGVTWTSNGVSMSATNGDITLNNSTVTLSGTASTTGNFNIAAAAGTYNINTVTAGGNFTNAGTGTSTINTVNATGTFNITGTGTQSSQNITAGGNINLSAGTLTHPVGTASQIYSLNLTSTSGSLLMSGAATINVNNKGYPSGYSFGDAGVPSVTNISATSRGAAHAGYGGGSGATGLSYDNPKNPSLPGGGKGGTVGGGVVRIIANSGTCQLDGTSTITAAPGGTTGAAGGSIYMKCNAFAGASTSTPMISVNGGGSTTTIGGGSGGMIALISNGNASSYTGSFAYPTSAATLTTFLTKIRAYGGAYTNATYPEGGPGTIYLKNSANGSGDLIIAHDNGANNGTGTAANIGYTSFASISDNSNIVSTSPDANTLEVWGANNTDRTDWLKGLDIHIFGLAASKNPLDGTHITATLTANDFNRYYTTGNPFPAINSDKYYRMVYRFNKVDISGKAKVDLGTSDLVVDLCDIHSAAATTFDVPASSSLKANVLSMPTCSTKTGTITNVNGSF